MTKSWSVQFWKHITLLQSIETRLNLSVCVAFRSGVQLPEDGARRSELPRGAVWFWQHYALRQEHLLTVRQHLVCWHALNLKQPNLLRPIFLNGKAGSVWNKAEGFLMCCLGDWCFVCLLWVNLMSEHHRIQFLSLKVKIIVEMILFSSTSSVFIVVCFW